MIQGLFTRRSKGPFARAKGPTLLFHGCYHKAGTHWLRRILRGIGARYGLVLRTAPKEAPPHDHGIYVDGHSKTSLEGLPPHRGSHMVRDPRDMVVSGYFYHLWTKETWAHVPQPKYDGLSYQQHINRLDREEGLLQEIERARALFRRMRSWDYHNPHILEIKYEELQAEEEPGFRRLFAHYGFHPEAIEAGLAVARECSFHALSKRPVGAVQEATVMRSGKAGQWRDLFTDRIKERFKQRTGDLLVYLGYERDDAW